MNAIPKITPVIMCGGSGTRLWPLSRETHPKQFAPLVAGVSTFRQALARVNEPGTFDRPIVITNHAFRFMVADQAEKVSIKADILLEPVGRDSGPAIAVASEFAFRRDPHTVLLVLAADHIIRDVEGFRQACRDGLQAAAAGYLVTFGVRPDRPSTSYGYIKPGKAIAGCLVAAIDRFVEKPDPSSAQQHLDDGYLWNSGNFLFRAKTMLNELAKFEPQILEAARTSLDKSERDLAFIRLPQAFSHAPKKSIDYCVMERTSHAAILPVHYGWSDVGSWNALWQELDHDQSGNSVEGPAHLVDTKDSLVISDESILTTLVGLDDVIVISTPDAVLVVPKSRSEQVKELVSALKAKQRREVTEHRRVYRPWGYYQSVDTGARYQVKRIVVNQGGKLSLQKHHHRSEHWVVVRGVAEVVVNDTISTVSENESIYVPLGARHRLSNPGKIPLELIEVQVGSYLGEDDIVRLDDVYKRT